VTTSLRQSVAETGSIPLSFVLGDRVANLGDALSPVMVTLLSGLPCSHKAQNSTAIRMAAVGTIAHGFTGGEVWLWGTGTSKYRNPLHKGPGKEPFIPNSVAKFRVTATRGPVTRRILGDENAVGTPAYGDPVWLLPRFYRPKLKKRWKLGVIVHLADLKDRSLDAQVKDAFLRYQIPESERGSVRLINTVTDVTPDALRARLNDILECERLVSTSLHGMVFAESYGIPCLYFSPRGKVSGLSELDLLDEDSVDLRIIDLYRGMGRNKLPVYVQDRKKHTDWAHLMRTIDDVWRPIDFDTDPLINAFPLDLWPLKAPAGKTIFDHPLIQSIPITKRNPEHLREVLQDSKPITDLLQFWRR